MKKRICYIAGVVLLVLAFGVTTYAVTNDRVTVNQDDGSVEVYSRDLPSDAREAKTYNFGEDTLGVQVGDTIMSEDGACNKVIAVNDSGYITEIQE